MTRVFPFLMLRMFLLIRSSGFSEETRVRGFWPIASGMSLFSAPLCKRTTRAAACGSYWRLNFLTMRLKFICLPFVNCYCSPARLRTLFWRIGWFFVIESPPGSAMRESFADCAISLRPARPPSETTSSSPWRNSSTLLFLLRPFFSICTHDILQAEGLGVTASSKPLRLYHFLDG